MKWRDILGKVIKLKPKEEEAPTEGDGLEVKVEHDEETGQPKYIAIDHEGPLEKELETSPRYGPAIPKREIMDSKEYNSPGICDEDMFYAMVEEEILARIDASFNYVAELPVGIGEAEEMGRFIEISNCATTPWNHHSELIWKSVMRGMIERYPHKKRTLQKLARVVKKAPGIVYQHVIQEICERADVKELVDTYWVEREKSKEQRKNSMQDLLDD